MIEVIRGWAPGLFDAVELPWSQRTIKMFGKEVMQPRLTCMVGCDYRYSGTLFEAVPWTDVLAGLRDRVNDEFGVEVNSVLGNLYRDEKDSIGWHRDNERGLGDTIVSLSLGESRRFRVEGSVVELGDGDVVVVRGRPRHCVPKEKGTRGPRINLTFRWLKH